MSKDFPQLRWNEQLAQDWHKLLALAFAEDLGDLSSDGPWGDITSKALLADDTPGEARIVLRQRGVLSGLPAIEPTLNELDDRLHCVANCQDGHLLEAGSCIGRLEGPARSILAAERLLLNLLGHLSGIATLTRRYVDAVAGTSAQIYDTRKTTPGWRRLEKYAVRCGGGRNHRESLATAVLIKDNHLVLGAEGGAADSRFSPSEAVRRARRFLLAHHDPKAEDWIVEIEVDSLEQLAAVLPACPDIVLLDNMDPSTLRRAKALRDRLQPGVELEASGGVNLDMVRQIAESGVERISVGSLTHSAPALDLGLDWSVG